MGWVAFSLLAGFLGVRWYRGLVRCNLCKRRFTPTADLIDVWDREWSHCPYCRTHGRPADAPEGADGCRLKRA